MNPCVHYISLFLFANSLKRACNLSICLKIIFQFYLRESMFALSCNHSSQFGVDLSRQGDHITLFFSPLHKHNIWNQVSHVHIISSKHKICLL